MTTYDLYKKISNILAPTNNRELFDYIIHATDNYGGFLRSRFCRADVTLPNKKCGEIKTVLVALAEPFDFSTRDYYKERGALLHTRLKMQIYLCDLSDGDKFRFAAAITYFTVCNETAAVFKRLKFFSGNGNESN